MSSVVFAVHDRQIAEHGGLPGVRDLGGVEAALARPRHLAACGAPDVCDLSAAYAYGLVRGHCFADGNKRTAWVITRVFLADHGARLMFDQAEGVRAMTQLAAGKMDEATFAAWLRRGCGAATSERALP
jgi:death-on-curing protein